MTIDTVTARNEWAARVAKQAVQLKIVAAATPDLQMERELLEDANRLTHRASEILACAA